MVYNVTAPIDGHVPIMDIFAYIIKKNNVNK